MTTMKKAALAAVSAAGLLAAGGAAHAATIFSATLESAQSQNPDLPDGASMVFGQASLALSLSETADGFNLGMSLNFQDTMGLLDWSEVADSGIIDVVGSAVPRDDDAFTINRLHIHAADRGETGPVVFGLFDLLDVPASIKNSDEDGETTLFLFDNGSATLLSEWDFSEGTMSGTLEDFISELAGAVEGDDIGLYFNLHAEEAHAGLIRGQVGAENSDSPVPVPAALPLFASGAAGLAFMRRRQRKNAG
jgi:hypothetical protein